MKKEILLSCVLLIYLVCAEALTAAPAGQKNLSNYRITVLFNDYKTRKDLTTGWGFSCLIEGTEKIIIFDIGSDSKTLMYNIEVLKIDPTIIDIMVISHNHEDHVKGIEPILRANPGLPAYIPESIVLGDNIKIYGGKPLTVSEPFKICEDIWSTGTFDKIISEQSLIINTDQGMIIITGCAHPGVINIIEHAEAITGQKKTLLLMGGFHLSGFSEEEIQDIIAQMKQHNVMYVAPSHCTGDRAIKLFKKAYKKFFLASGAGHVITSADLKIKSGK